jgi:hypothetical protein
VENVRGQTFEDKKSVSSALSSDFTTLKKWQKLMGRLADISQMCNFMKLFRMSVVDCIQGIESSAPAMTQVKISKDAKEDLRVWANFLMCPLKWLPISAGISEPPKWSREFVSDAAGLSDPLDFHKRPGCGNVAFDTDWTIIFAHQYL